VSWAILDQALVSGSNFVSGILLARILGPDEFGRYVLAWTALLLIQALQHAGITSAMLSIGPREDGDRSSLYYGSMVVQHIVFLTGTTAVAALCLLALAAVRPDWRVAELILPMTMALVVCLTHDLLRRISIP